MFRFTVLLACIRKSPRATQLTRCAIHHLFNLLDTRNSLRDRSLPT